ncbi:MAG: hypothetical protein ACP6IU_15145 [Candidatus Asgardarchaeia archaeon]
MPMPNFEEVWEYLKKIAKEEKTIRTLSRGSNNKILDVSDHGIIVLSESGKGKERILYKTDFHYAWKKLVSKGTLTLEDIAPELHGKKAIILAFLARLPFVTATTYPKIELKLSTDC